MAIKLVAPNGSAIIGTLELIPGVALIDCVLRSDGGQISFEYEGETTIDWDSQKTVTRKGKTVFVAEDGGEYTEDQLVPTPKDEEADESDGRAA